MKKNVRMLAIAATTMLKRSMKKTAVSVASAISLTSMIKVKSLRKKLRRPFIRTALSWIDRYLANRISSFSLTTLCVRLAGIVFCSFSISSAEYPERL